MKIRQPVLRGNLLRQSEQRQELYDMGISLDNKLHNHSLSSHRTRTGGDKRCREQLQLWWLTLFFTFGS